VNPRFTVLAARVAYRLPVTYPRGAGTNTFARVSWMATKHQKDTENLVFGAYTGTIYRRTDLKHSSYFLRVFIKEEGKYIRRSLQTDDAVQARKAATEHIIHIFTKVESGQRVPSFPAFKITWRPSRLTSLIEPSF
jgi:hypothetical protein